MRAGLYSFRAKRFLPLPASCSPWLTAAPPTQLPSSHLLLRTLVLLPPLGALWSHQHTWKSRGSHLKVLNFITPVKSLSPNKVTQSQLLGLQSGHHGGWGKDIFKTTTGIKPDTSGINKIRGYYRLENWEDTSKCLEKCNLQNWPKKK